MKLSYTDSEVSKAVASLLFVLFSFGLISPALVSDPQSKLPACCRRDGKHHCASIKDSSSEGQSLQALQQNCPNFPQSKSTAVPAPFHFAVSWHEFHAALTGYPAVCAQNEALYRISYSRTGQKRGPPSFAG
jgi:hypothetical protein